MDLKNYKYTKEQNDLLMKYTERNMWRLKSITHKLLKRYGGVSQSEYDDFYSIANMELIKAVVTWNPSKSDFNTFLYGNISRKFKTRFRDIHHPKRCKISKNKKGEIIYEKEASLDAPMSLNNKETLLNYTSFSVSPEESYFTSLEQTPEDRVDQFYKTLTKRQTLVLDELKNDVKETSQIARNTGLTPKQVEDCLTGIKLKSNILHRK